ncbi:MAG: CapA family protein [Candidatus Peregrinibacteria bacterium]
MKRVRFPTKASIACAALILSACTASPTITEQHAEGDSATVLLVGDTSYYEHYSRAAEMLKQKGYDYPFSSFKSMLQSADLVVANLEALITDLRDSPFEGKKTYILRQTPKALQYLKKFNIGAVNIANNHAWDFEMKGLTQSMRYLEAAEIPFFGAGANEREALRPFLHDVPLSGSTFKLAIVSGVQYNALLDKTYDFYASSEKGGVMEADRTEFIDQIRNIKKKEPERFVIVFPHWGFNYSWRNDAQQALAERFLDAGADIVIGHGAHRMQEVAFLKHHWVMYDLGNFVFCSWGRYKKLNSPPYSFIAALHITPTPDKNDFTLSVHLYPIFTDNSRTDFQPRFVTAEEFEEVWNILLTQSDQIDILRTQMHSGQDQYGHYFELPVR